jgi:hypothetical protein
MKAERALIASSVALGYLDVFYVSLLFLAIHYLMEALAIARVVARACGQPATCGRGTC